MTIEKTYDATTAEAKHYARWEASGAFACDPHADKPTYTIMMPPPNVTGSLHMGHALTFTLQDVLARYHRMIGYDVLWQPGTDHAGIATQMVVERQLAAQGITRQELGREKFLEKVWAWKAESGGTITQQLRRLGASPDWARERFTMDEGLSKAVNKVFVELYKQDLIYKAKRLVNWDPKLQTAISDLEVEQKEVRGNLWHIRYPLETPFKTADGEIRTHITIATTRPETMLGDVAVAVHPDDERYQDLIGEYVILPLVERRIPIIADEYADPTKGSGAVKITPAHDFNDFEVGKRHDLPIINVLDKNAHIMNPDRHRHIADEATIPEAYVGLERYAARMQIIADLEALELLEKIEPNTHSVPHGDRSGVVIEPWLSEQWYVNAAELAEPALAAVEKGDTQFVPEQWQNTYYAWMRNIEPWCISRQLWWGHQVPAWYGYRKVENSCEPEESLFVAETAAEAQRLAEQHYGQQVAIAVDQNHAIKIIVLSDQPAIWRDTDVLDTWFSSALWPFSTLGWPDDESLLPRYYPNADHPDNKTVLVTGFDIIFFWVARMMMMGLHFQNQVPFQQVYIHALVRDEKGQKMSKSKGNVIDPLAMIDQYGCDALRFTLTALSTPGRDIKLAPAQIEGYRNFTTKLWNVARFCQMNGCVYDPAFAAQIASSTTPLNHAVNAWIVQRLWHVVATLQAHYAAHRFDLIAQTLYQFVWYDFCDWYVELAKPVLQTENADGQAETQKTAAWVLVQMLKLLHPIMPFITEELWSGMIGEGAGLLISQAWPTANHASFAGEATEQEINWLIALISEIRAVRSQLNVPAGTMVALQVQQPDAVTQQFLATHAATIKRMARIETIASVATPPPQAAQIVLPSLTLFMPLVGVIDFAVERQRLEKDSKKLADDNAKLAQKLANADFVAKAPPEEVAKQQQRLQDNQTLLVKIQTALQALAAC